MAASSDPEPYVYHRVPPKLRGTVLYPLNQLEDVYPDLYLQLQQNYATRLDIAALRIPPLDDCLWNDVLHMSPVHPTKLKAALAAAGHEMHSEWRRFYQIDASLLDPASTVLYRMSEPLWSGHFDIDEASAKIGSDCVGFRPELLAAESEVPESTRNYFASVLPGEDHPAYFLGITHVLHRGKVDITRQGISVVEV